MSSLFRSHWFSTLPFHPPPRWLLRFLVLNSDPRLSSSCVPRGAMTSVTSDRTTRLLAISKPELKTPSSRRLSHPHFPLSSSSAFIWSHCFCFRSYSCMTIVFFPSFTSLPFFLYLKCSHAWMSVWGLIPHNKRRSQYFTSIHCTWDNILVGLDWRLVSLKLVPLWENWTLFLCFTSQSQNKISSTDL